MLLEYKEAGMTCNDHIILLKNKYNRKKMAYTARLDPMARGVVPILVDDECKQLNSMLHTNKKYRVKVIVGIKTDSDDPLGLITSMNTVNINIDDFIKKYGNMFELSNKSINQQYHYFSTVALNNRKRGNNMLSYHMVTLHTSVITKWGYLNFKEWRNEIISTIMKVDINNNNRFRQKEIIEQWNSLDSMVLPYIEIELDVSSGFFVRQFIADFSMDLMCFDIHRINVY